MSSYFAVKTENLKKIAKIRTGGWVVGGVVAAVGAVDLIFDKILCSIQHQDLIYGYLRALRLSRWTCAVWLEKYRKCNNKDKPSKIYLSSATTDHRKKRCAGEAGRR